MDLPLRDNAMRATTLGLVTTLLLTAGCASSSEPTEQPDAGNSPSCPTIANTCPDSCQVVSASLVRPTCIEKGGSVIGCAPKTIITMDEVCVRGTTPDAGAYIVPSGSWGTWLTQPDGGFEPCTADERMLPNGTPKPVCDP